MTRRVVRLLVLTLLGLTVVGLGPALAQTQAKPEAAGGPVVVAGLTGPVSPAMAQFAVRVLDRAHESKAQAVVFLLDTPGGLDTSMRRIVQAILNSPVPVIVYVAPKGARAASAGLMITLAGHVAAMAPGTNLGAAHPVQAGGGDVQGTMNEKVTNDMVAYVKALAHLRGRNADWAEKAVRQSVSLPAVEAAAEGVIDVVAPDLVNLLNWADGRKVKVDEDRLVALKTKNRPQEKIEPTFRDRILGTIADPTLAYLLFMLGLVALYFELSHPGAILPGVVGAISLILAFFAFQTLSVSLAGILLLLVGLALLIVELYVVSYGLLTMTGLACLTLGSIMLFEETPFGPQLSWWTIGPTLLAAAAFFVGVIILVWRSQRRPRPGGVTGVVGLVGEVTNWDEAAGRGQIFVRGEIWRAEGPEGLKAKDRVQVVLARGLTVQVRPVKEEEEK